MNKLVEIIITILIFMFIFFIYKDQKTNTLNGGKGYDGTEYYKTVEQYKAGKSIVTGYAPFVKRLGMPKLVSTFSNYWGFDILKSAFYVNLLAAFFIVILNVFWFRIFVNSFWLRFFLNLLYMLGWQNSLRYSFFYPLNSDSWGVVFLLLGLIFMQKIKNYYREKEKGFFLGIFLFLFSLIIFLGVFFRESCILLAFVLPFIISPINIKRVNFSTFYFKNFFEFGRILLLKYQPLKHKLLFLPIIFGFLAFFIVSKLVQVQANGYSYFFTALSLAYQKSLPEYFLAIFNAFGPLIILVIYNFKNNSNFFKNYQELFLILIFALILGLIGGSGSERILFNISFPIVYILIAYAVQKIENFSYKWWLFVILFIQAFAYRFFWFTPDYEYHGKKLLLPFFTLVGEKFGFLKLFSDYGNKIINMIIFIQYMLLLIITGFILINKKYIVKPTNTDS